MYVKKTGQTSKKGSVISKGIILILTGIFVSAGTVLGNFSGNDPQNFPDDTIWKSTNPGAGGAFGAAGAGPTGVIIVGGDLAGAYRSLDRGKSWNQIGSYQGLTDTHICGLGFDPSNPSIIFIGAEHGLYRSSDTGATVSKVIDNGYITDIKISNVDNLIAYAAYNSKYNSLDGQVYKSTDNGEHWSKISTDLPAGLHISKILIEPGSSNVVYILSGKTDYASGMQVAYRSNDGGVHWSRIASSEGEIKDLVINQLDPSNLYMSTYPTGGDDFGYFYCSLDSGSSWTQFSHRTGMIFLSPDNPGFIRLIEVGYQYSGGSRSGVWASSDSGKNWDRFSDVGEDWDNGWSNLYHYGKSFNGDVKTFGEDMSDPDVIFWITSQWVFATSDKGLTFQNLYTDEISPNTWQSRGINDAVLFDIEISPANPDIIYLGYFDLGISRSMDHGLSWQNSNSSVYTVAWKGDGGSTYTIAADPTRENVVWASAGQDRGSTKKLIRSSDYGSADSWKLAGNGLPTTISLHGLSINRYSPESSRILFITASRNVYKSTDDGYNWSLVLDSGGKCHFTAIDYFNGDLVYAGGSGGIWRSLNGGETNTWVQVGMPEMAGNITGDLWDSGWSGVMDIKTDPLNPGWVYIAVFGNNKGLYRSKDKGETWTKLLTDNYMRGVTLSPVNPDIIYAASSKPLNSGGYNADSHGVMKSINGGVSWLPVNEGLSFPFASTIETDPLNPQYIMIASPGEGARFRYFPGNGPVRMNLKPSGTLDYGTSSAFLSLTTTDMATCRYSSISGTDFDAMQDLYSSPDGINHTAAIDGLSDGNIYTYYCKCRDDKGNTNVDDYQITFMVGKDVTGIPVEKNEENFGIKVIPSISGNINFSVTLPVKGDFIVSVFDMSGRKIWSYKQAFANKGVYSVPWNDEKSMPGIYCVVLSSSKESKYTSLLFYK